jgi:hypothetical protein
MTEADTIRTSIMSLAAQHIVQIWSRYIYPLPYDRVLHDNGRRVRVTVAEYEGDDVDRRLEKYSKGE